MGGGRQDRKRGGVGGGRQERKKGEVGEGRKEKKRGKGWVGGWVMTSSKK